jgi:hypothetical protein
MTRAGDRAPSMPARALAFMRAADDFARPAPLLFFLIEELEALPRLDPALPLLTFSLFDDLPTIPDSAPVPPANRTSQRRPPDMARSADENTWPGHPAFSGSAPHRPSWHPFAPDLAVGSPNDSLWQPDRREGTPLPPSAVANAASPSQPAFSRSDEPRERRPLSDVGSASSARTPPAPARANGHGRTDPDDQWTTRYYRHTTHDFAANAPFPPTRRPNHLPDSTHTPSPLWPDPDDALTAPHAPTPAFSWEPLAYIDALANELLTRRPTAPPFTNTPDIPTSRHPDTLTPDLPITPSPYYPITSSHAEFPTSDLRPPTSDSPPFEPDDIAEMVTDVLIEQARRHGVDLS